MTPRLIADYQCETGENTLWHTDEQRLYWTDIPTGRLFRYDPATGAHEQVYDDRQVGGFTFQADGALLLFRDKGNVVVWRDGQVRDTIIESLPDEETTRFNDVMADPEGRVYCGTMPTKTRKGRLYRLDPDGSIRILLEGIGCSNGMGFTPDGSRMYYTDSTARHIYLFDYDRSTGDLNNQRVFVETPEGEGVPDGMCVDAAGDVWSTRWGGWGVFRYGPDGQLKQKIDIPAQAVSCCCFHGSTLYITTALANKRPETGEQAGALYAVDTDAQGQTEHRSRIEL